MREYRVLGTETIGGWIYVRANSLDEAEALAYSKLEDEGGAAIDHCTHREYELIGETEET